MLVLTDLHCNNINSLTGHDEVYLLFTPDNGTTYRYPTWNHYAMSQDQSDLDSNWALGRSVWFNNSVTVSLWDGNDSLGPATTFSLSNFNGPGATKKNNIHRDGSISNGWNVIDYDLTAQLVK